MKNILSSAIFLFLLTSCAYTQSKDITQRIHDVETHLSGWIQTQHDGQWTLAARMAHYRLKGLSIAVIDNYKVDWAKGYGWADSSEGRQVTTATLFQAASISKSLNGVGVLRLVQDEKLDLNVDVNQYLKDWKFPYDSVSKGKKITLAELPSHTAGLTVHGFPGYDINDSLPTIPQILDGQRPANNPRIRSMSEPGLSPAVYSGGGITLSQLVVMNSTGLPYDTYMRDSILQPMGMTGSFYTQPAPADKKTLLATGYRANGVALHGRSHVYPEQAAAGLWTNPTDLAHYIIATQQSLDGQAGGVLSPATTKLRLTPFIDSSAALGVFILQRGDDKYFSHGGANEGFRSQYYGSLHGGRGVVVMVNSDNGAIMDEIINSVASVYKWEGFYKPVVKTEIDAPAPLDQYTGQYALGSDTVRVFQKEGKIFLDVRFDQWQLHFVTADEFFLYDQKGDFQFTRGNGRVSSILVNHQQTYKKINQ